LEDGYLTSRRALRIAFILPAWCGFTDPEELANENKTDEKE